jgi:uncharacterized membrane protein YfcA
LPSLTASEWLLAIVAALTLGVGKAGLAGLSLLHVVIFAFLFGARDSTGVVLPLLLVGDVCAVVAYHRHTRWDYVRRMLPPACLGVAVAAAFMRGIGDAAFRPLIGGIVLCLAVLQAVRMQRPDVLGKIPHARPVAWNIGILAGISTMLANAAGPVIAVYCVAVALPKFEIVGTMAWFFFLINAFKVPFSAGLGLIRRDTLLLNATLVPAVILGVLGGRWLVHRLPQRIFDLLMLGFAALASLRLIFG